MGNAHLKRFFWETYGDITMYEDYLCGDAFVNQELYLKWLKDVDNRNKIFAKSLSDFNRIHNKNIIIESALTSELTISKYLLVPSNNVNTVVSNFGSFQLKDESKNPTNNHYICNGYFIDTLKQIYNVLDNGSFTVGICAEKKTDMYREVVEYYGKLRSFLLKNGYNTSAIQSNVNSKNRVYLLMYDSKFKNRVKR